LHKVKIALKELRETLIWLKIIQRKRMLTEAQMRDIVGECDELIAIFVSSVKTAESNQRTMPGRAKSGLQKSAINNQHSTFKSNLATPTPRIPR
jgi:hypothetical protein